MFELVDFYESDSYNAMTSFTKLFFLQNDSEHSKNNFVHTSYNLVFFKWMKTDISFDFDSFYMYMHIISVFFKRQEHFNILHC